MHFSDDKGCASDHRRPRGQNLPIAHSTARWQSIATWKTDQLFTKPSIYPTRLDDPSPSLHRPIHCSPTQGRSSGKTPATRPPGNLCSSYRPLPSSDLLRGTVSFCPQSFHFYRQFRSSPIKPPLLEQASAGRIPSR